MSQEEKLPKEIRSRFLGNLEYEAKEREEVLDNFLNRILKLNSEDPENFKKSIFILSKAPAKKKQNNNARFSHKSSKKLSLRKRKELGLYTLGKKSLKYKELLPLHRLWKEYMTSYMNLEELQEWTNNHEDTNFEYVSQKLYRADYHGSLMKVIRSKCPSYFGVSGIVVMDTKNCFKLLGKDNIVRTIPKASCEFSFDLHDFNFTFFGKSLQVRPAERSSRKIKNLHVNDM